MIGNGDKGEVIHTNGSLRYRGRVVVPQSVDLREDPQGVPLLLFFCAPK